MAETQIFRKGGGYVHNPRAAFPGAGQQYQQPQQPQHPHQPTMSQTMMTPQQRRPLPRVDVNMTSGGPQVQNGHVLQNLPHRPQYQQVRGPAHSVGGLPPVIVRMGAGGPQVISGIPDHGQSRVVNPWVAGQRPNPQQAPMPQPMQQPMLQQAPAPQFYAPAPPNAPSLSSDQLLFCRFLVDNFRRGENVSQDHATLSETIIATIDATMAAAAIAEAEANAAIGAQPIPQQPVQQAPQVMQAPMPPMPQQMPPQQVQMPMQPQMPMQVPLQQMQHQVSQAERVTIMPLPQQMPPQVPQNVQVMPLPQQQMQQPQPQQQAYAPRHPRVIANQQSASVFATAAPRRIPRPQANVGDPAVAQPIDAPPPGQIIDVPSDPTK